MCRTVKVVLRVGFTHNRLFITQHTGQLLLLSISTAIINRIHHVAPQDWLNELFTFYHSLNMSSFCFQFLFIVHFLFWFWLLLPSERMFQCILMHAAHLTRFLGLIWDGPSKYRLDQLSYFCTAHPCDKHIDRQPCHINTCSNSPHLALLAVLVMQQL